MLCNGLLLIHYRNSWTITELIHDHGTTNHPRRVYRRKPEDFPSLLAIIAPTPHSLGAKVVNPINKAGLADILGAMGQDNIKARPNKS